MRKYLTISMALVGLLALVGASLAFAAKPTTVRQGNLILTVNGDFFPKKLPKKKYAPVGFEVSAKLRTKDGSHPPALKAFNVETDKNGYIDTTGYPTCRSGQLQARNTVDALKVCRKALIGRGKTTAQINFPEQTPFSLKSDLLVLNGGTKGKKTTLFIHAYLSSPVTAAIVTTVKTKRIKKGRYGILAVSSIPRIAGGAGAVTDFNLKIDKKFVYKGKKRSVLGGRCPDGKLVARGEALFYDAPDRVKAEVLRTCKQRG